MTNYYLTSINIGDWLTFLSIWITLNKISVRNSQITPFASVRKNSRWKMYREIMAVCCKSLGKAVLCIKRSVFIWNLEVHILTTNLWTVNSEKRITNNQMVVGEIQYNTIQYNTSQRTVIFFYILNFSSWVVNDWIKLSKDSITTTNTLK
jgi:hypothetical protein